MTPGRERQAAYRRRKAEAEGRTLGPVGRPPGPSGRHGTPAIYNGGCRCDECRAANTERVRAKRAARKALGDS